MRELSSEFAPASKPGLVLLLVLALFVWVPLAHSRTAAIPPILQVDAHGVRVGTTIADLAADGDRVVFTFGPAPNYVTGCDVATWRAGAAHVIPVELGPPNACVGLSPSGFFGYSPAIAGRRVAFGTHLGGIQPFLSLWTTTLPSRSSTFFVSSSGGCCAPENPFEGSHLGDLLGTGSLLVFSTWTVGCVDQAQPCTRGTTSQTIWRLRKSSGQCPVAGKLVATSVGCVRIAAAAQELSPLAVDGRRIVLRRADGSLVMIDFAGRPLRSFKVAHGRPIAAALSGEDLVVLARGSLLDYDAASGALRHSWRLPSVASSGSCGTVVFECPTSGIRLRFAGAAAGFASYVFDGKVHVLRLRDGRDATVLRATLARLTTTGLFTASTAIGDYPGRISFRPFNTLPLR